MSVAIETIRVLLVEDDSTISSMLVRMLRTKEVKVLPYLANLKNTILTFDPHVVVLDYTLPDGNAFDALKQFPNVNSKRNIPIVYTAHKLPCQLQTQLHLEGVMNVIQKPIGFSTIESLIENYYEISMKYRS